MKILLLSADDWRSIWIDGEKKRETHSLYEEDVIQWIMEKGEPVTDFVTAGIERWIEEHPDPNKEEDWEYWDEFQDAMVKQMFGEE